MGCGTRLAAFPGVSRNATRGRVQCDIRPARCASARLASENPRFEGGARLAVFPVGSHVQRRPGSPLWASRPSWCAGEIGWDRGIRTPITGTKNPGPNRWTISQAVRCGRRVPRRLEVYQEPATRQAVLDKPATKAEVISSYENISTLCKQGCGKRSFM